MAKRLDLALAELYPDRSRSFFSGLIEGGAVRVDGKTVKSKSFAVSGAETIEVDFPEPEALEITAEDIALDIVYEDLDLLVVNKPVGMVVHPAAGNRSGTLVNAVLNHCGAELSGINGVARPGIVHRIDKDTSGLLMIAKNDFAHVSLARQLAEHSITRAYRALVYGGFSEPEGTVEGYIGRDRKNRKKQAVIAPLPDGSAPQGARRAVTHYRLIEKLGRYSYIEARLETGRTHQIRVHMAYIGHPLLGDPLYGPKKAKEGVKTQQLHAYLLGFSHPRSGEYMEFRSPLPEGFETTLARLRRQS